MRHSDQRSQPKYEENEELSLKMFYLWGKGVLKAQLLQSWPKFEDGMDVKDRDG